jgi:hypothetical protein
MPFSHNAFIIHLSVSDFVHLIPELVSLTATEDDRRRSANEARSALLDLRDHWVALSMALTTWLTSLGSQTG